MSADSPPRIYRLTVCRVRVQGKPTTKLIRSYWIKVPYASLFGMVDTLARAMTLREVRWFKLEVARPEQIAEHRDELMRWDEALGTTAEVKYR